MIDSEFRVKVGENAIKAINSLVFVEIRKVSTPFFGQLLVKSPPWEEEKLWSA